MKLLGFPVRHTAWMVAVFSRMVKLLQSVPAPLNPCARTRRDEKTARTMKDRISVDATARCMGLDFIVHVG